MTVRTKLKHILYEKMPPRWVHKVIHYQMTRSIIDWKKPKTEENAHCIKI